MKTNSFGIRVPIRDVGTILYYYHTTLGSHGLTVGGCLRDVISQAAANIRAEHPEMGLSEDQATTIIAQLKGGSPEKSLNFGLPKPANLKPVVKISPEAIAEAAKEISEKEKPRPASRFEADIIDD